MAKHRRYRTNLNLRRIPWLKAGAVAGALVAIAVIVAHNTEGYAQHHLLNVSYDPTRELYRDIDPRFVDKYRKETGSSVIVEQSHGGSTAQAQRVANGELRADVVTLGLPSDVEALHNKGLIPDGWQDRLPNHAIPYNSTVVFLVRYGNPHEIHDWPDLLKSDVEVIMPDPKTSGNGKLAVLAAWGAIMVRGGTEAAAKSYLAELFKHMPFLEQAARMAGVAFAVENKGDVQLAWENEALREREQSEGKLEIIYPPVSILAEPAVAWIDANAAQDRDTHVARAYLRFLFTDQAQEIIARDGYRPFNRRILEAHADQFPSVNLFPISAIALDWTDAYRKFFGDNGIVDAVYPMNLRPE